MDEIDREAVWCSLRDRHLEDGVDEEEAAARADEDLEAVMRSKKRRGWNTLRGKALEDAEDLA